jgi:hypothetical protein
VNTPGSASSFFTSKTGQTRESKPALDQTNESRITSELAQKALAKSEERRAKSKERRAKSKEQRAKDVEQASGDGKEQEQEHDGK